MQDVNDHIDGFVRYDGNNSLVFTKQSRRYLKNCVQKKHRIFKGECFAVSIENGCIILVPYGQKMNGDLYNGLMGKLRRLDEYLKSKFREEDERLQELLGFK